MLVKTDFILLSSGQPVKKLGHILGLHFFGGCRSRNYRMNRSKLLPPIFLDPLGSQIIRCFIKFSLKKRIGLKRIFGKHPITKSVNRADNRFIKTGNRQSNASNTILHINSRKRPKLRESRVLTVHRILLQNLVCLDKKRADPVPQLFGGRGGKSHG